MFEKLRSRLLPAFIYGSLSIGLSTFPVPAAIAQETLAPEPLAPGSQASDSRVSDRERATADRFLQVLERRPRPGTALDRVYGFHVQNGTLDEFIKSLAVPDDDPEAGHKRMILGLLQSQRGQQALAAEAFAKAESLLPSDYAASYFLGRSLLAVGQTEKAAAAIERSIERKPARNEALPIFTELGRIYGRAGQSEKALEVWRKLEALFPGDSRVGGQIAATLAEEGNITEALARFEALSKSARKGDDKIAFAVQAAEMRRRMGQTDECTAALEKILARLRPGSWLYSDVRNRIEDGFLKSGDYGALANYYKEKLGDSTDNLDLQVRLGRILVSARRLDEAAETLSKAAARAPDDPDVRLALVDVLVSKGHMAAAAKQYELLAEKDPNNPDYLLRWGRLLLEDEKQPLADRRKSAAKVWLRLADSRPNDAVTLAQIADQMRSIDRADDAIALYKKAIDADPNSPQYREYLGEYFHRNDRKDEAIETWQSIAQGDRRNRDSLVRLAEVLGTFKQHQLALTTWRDAAKLDLTFPQELRFAQKLLDAKQFEESLARLEAAEKIGQTPDEQEQLLKARIGTYEQAGTLADQIARLHEAEPSIINLRTLAMMHSAAGQLADASAAIRRAVALEPENSDVLLVAADIAERQNRFSDAVATFQKLAKVDVRFRTNYLQRVADLQMRLGQVADALGTCDSLIDANPASPESYQFLARLAFRAGQDDQAFTALRRALNVAPRDNGPRRMLASAFADRYRTEEAIELYWQAMRYEAKTDGRIALVRQLAPLYDRKGEIDDLDRRINQMGRDNVDARTLQLMLSAAYESVADYGQARQAIDRLLASHPHDVSLLESMVRLSDAADDVVLAAEFQERIVALADTPENRFKLVQLQLDAEIIDIKTALSERISLSSDPARLGMMIRSAIRRGDQSTAIAICEAASEHDPSLWDVKLNLAQLLLLAPEDDKTTDDTSDKDKFPKHHRRAIQLAQEIRALKIPLTALPPTAKIASTRSNSSQARRASSSSSPTRWSASSYTIARAYRLGRYASTNYGYSSTQYTPPAPSSFGHARVLATSVEMVAIAKRYPDVEAAKKIQAVIEQSVALPPPEQIKNANLIWEHRALNSIAGQMTGPGSAQTLSSKEKQDAEQLSWRLAELDPSVGASSIRSILTARITRAAEQKASPNSKQTAEPPLTQRQVDLIEKIYERSVAKSKTNSSTSVSSVWPSQAVCQVILSDHYQQAGDTERAKEFELKPLPESASLTDTINAISFYLKLRMPEPADALGQRLLPAVRRDTIGKSTRSVGMSGTAGILISAGGSSAEFVDRHRFTLLDAVLAQAIRNTKNQRSRSTSLSDGTVDAYVRSASNSYYSFPVKAPLSTELLSPQVLSEFFSLIPGSDTSGRPSGVNISEEVIEYLDRPLEGAPIYEQKTRAVLAAFAYWWTKRPEECYRRLTMLCEQYPDDVDLQIERARLASELSLPRVALEALDSFDPLDSGMLVRKEMAALNLASRIGDIDRAKQAAERLFGLRMDTKTQLALAGQLQRLGMPDKSAAVLRRMRGGRAGDESTQLQIAQAFVAAGDADAAAEVAYTLLRKFSSGRSTTRNVTYYRQQAVSILRSANRLDPLIDQAKRRVESAPASIRARINLADLYTAAGRKEKAEGLWTEIAKDKPNDPRQLVARASALFKVKKYKESAALYLDAFDKDAQLFSQHVYQMTRAVELGKNYDEMYERLTRFNPDSIPVFRIDNLIRVGRNQSYSDAKRKFIAHVLNNSRVKQDFYRHISSIPAGERKKIPAIRETIINAICDPNAFSFASSIWRVSSRSSGGTANGPLKEVLELLTTDQEARVRFQKAAEIARRDDAHAPTADFLVAMIDLADPSKREASILTIRGLIEKQPTDKNKISGGLLWQAGQILETFDLIDDKTSLLVAVYEAACDDPSVSETDMQYSAGVRLVDALVKDGQKSRARKHLLIAYKNTDHSADNRYNPGYGDSQDIQSYQSIAKKLDEIGWPIDALLVHQRLLAYPDRFEKAKRWSGNLSLEKAKKAADLVTEKITPTASADYLQELEKSLPNQTETLAIKLLDLPVDVMYRSGTEPGIQIAIQSAALSQDGRAALKSLAKTLATEAENRPDDWSIPAAGLLVAIKSGSNDLSRWHQMLKKRLPSIDDVQSSIDTPNSPTFQPLTGLIAVASVAAKSDNDAANQIGVELAEYLGVVAKTVRAPGLELALASLGKNDADSFSRFLDTIEDSLDADTRVTKRQVSACLNVASEAAKRGDIGLSARALRVALGKGPPLRQFGTGGDAFAINQNQNLNPISMKSPEYNTTLTRRLLEIVDLYSDATGEQLGRRDSKPLEIPNPPAINQQTWVTLSQAIQAIVLPQDQPGIVFPYAKRIASRTEYDTFNNSVPLVPESLSIAMARTAAFAGTTDALIDTLESRMALAADKRVVAGMMVDAALAAEDPEALAQALQQFSESVDAHLPALETPETTPQQITTITTQVRQESYKKSDLVDLMIQTLAPVVVAEEKQAFDNDEKVTELLERTAKLIESDSYTSGRHREIVRRIRSKVLNNAIQSGDSTAVHNALGQERVTFSQMLFGGAASHQSDEIAREARLGQLIEDGLLSNSANFVRKMISQESRPYSKTRLPLVICLETVKLPAQEQYDFLERMALGRSDSDSLLHWGGLVQDSDLKGIKTLSTCGPKMPIADTFLILADLAAQLGHSEKLAAKLSARSKNIGDHADIAAAIVRLAASPDDEQDWKWIQPTIDAIATQVAESKPAQTDRRLVFPTLSLFLATRALDDGISTTQVQKILQDLKIHAKLGQYKQIELQIESLIE